jgi:hypothetical protein
MNIIFGIPEERKPLRGFKKGKIKIRLRNTEYAKVYIKTKDGIKLQYICDAGEYWEPYKDINGIDVFGGNIRIKKEQK